MYKIWNKLCNSIICILSVTTNIWKTRWNSNSCVLKQEKESVPEATPPAAVQLQLAVLPVPPAQQCSDTVVPVQPQLPSPTSPAVQWDSCAGTTTTTQPNQPSSETVVPVQAQLPSPTNTGSSDQPGPPPGPYTPTPHLELLACEAHNYCTHITFISYICIIFSI